MTQVASRELRNNTRRLLDRVAGGESITITVDGIPMAVLEPVGSRQRWIPRDEFARQVIARQADSALAEELATMLDETTEDLEW